MYLRVIVAICAMISLLLPASAPATAQTASSKGLFVSPLREYLTVDAGKAQQKHLTIANYTDRPMDVALTVEKFSVTDYSYDYEFGPNKDAWIRLATPSVRIEPGKSQQVAYTILAPQGSAPGGNYFTIIASTNLGDHRVQAATLLYITVNGPLNQASTILGDTLPAIAFSDTIPYKLDVKNIGNNHFFIFLSGSLEGLTAKPPVSEAGHIMMPGTARSLGGSISAPILPGIYKATYGYTTSANDSQQRSKYILFLPPWSLAIPLGLGIILVVWRRRASH